MASPIVLLSGCVGCCEEYTRVEGFSNRDVGAVVLKEARQRDPAARQAQHRHRPTAERIEVEAFEVDGRDRGRSHQRQLSSPRVAM